MEEDSTKLPVAQDNQEETYMQEAPTETIGSKKMKPRALIFRAHNQDLEKIKELLKTQFPEVQILYMTTGPAACIMRVYKSMPLEAQDKQEQPLYTIE